MLTDCYKQKIKIILDEYSYEQLEGIKHIMDGVIGSDCKARYELLNDEKENADRLILEKIRESENSDRLYKILSYSDIFLDKEHYVHQKYYVMKEPLKDCELKSYKNYCDLLDKTVVKDGIVMDELHDILVDEIRTKLREKITTEQNISASDIFHDLKTFFPSMLDTMIFSDVVYDIDTNKRKPSGTTTRKKLKSAKVVIDLETQEYCLACVREYEIRPEIRCYAYFDCFNYKLLGLPGSRSGCIKEADFTILEYMDDTKETYTVKEVKDAFKEACIVNEKKSGKQLLKK